MQSINELWGIPIVKIKEYGKRYRLLSSIIIFIDALVTIILLTMMYFKGVSLQVYFFIMVLLCIFVTLWLNTYLNPVKWEAYKFYNKFKRCICDEYRYKVDSNQLYNVLYCSGYKRLKLDKDLDFYKELIVSACCEDYIYAKRVMKYLDKYKCTDSNMSESNLFIQVINKGKKTYFINFLKED